MPFFPAFVCFSFLPQFGHFLPAISFAFLISLFSHILRYLSTPAIDYGSPILAAADGTVAAATWHDSYGYYVKIQHDGTYSTLYAHYSALLVSAGQQVKKGQVIAQVGSTGDSTGSHLHFEVSVNDVRVDALISRQL